MADPQTPGGPGDGIFATFAWMPWGMEMDLEAFLKEVLAPVLDFPDELEVEVKKNGRQGDVFLRSPKADRGRIIGRNGKMISSLRTLCRAAGEKQGFSVNLELVEDDED